ncbi:MAG: hypothetical protein ACI3Y0_11740 [Prevotella sp.]
MPVISNNTKAVLFTENYCDHKNLKSENANVVQKLDYTLQRPRNDFGKPYGRMSGSVLNITIPIGSNFTKEFYERLLSNESQALTFIYNITYNESGTIASFDSAMVAEGYVIELAERYSTEPEDNEEKEVIMLDISFLLTAITYVGDNVDLKHDFVNLYS